MSAWSRHHRSGGFGIHSPYAYRFVRTVLRERKHYYAYQGMGELISTVKQNTTSGQRREMDLLSQREARLLFRVTNFFNPQHILQIGAATGIESVAMLEVNSESRLWLYDPNIEHNALAVRVLQRQMNRVACYDDAQVAAEEFLQAAGERMALVNVTVEEAVLKRLLDAGAVVILRNMHRDEAMWTLFEACCDYMPMGQTYTNGKTAILNPNPKLQREDFLLWL
ncbi:MAG: hypothetical protein IJK93_10595 [Muribaculaceae bacterium]|nr:hypothetical protein [Muribaculaceae bacterium]